MLDSVVEKLKAHAGQITVMYRCPFCGCRIERDEWLYEREEKQEVRCGLCGFNIFEEWSNDKVAEAKRRVQELMDSSPFK